MDTATRTFSLDEQPEVFASTAASSAAVRRAVAAGKARKIAGRLYTGNVEDPIDQVVRRNWQAIAAHYFPHAVIVDRSAMEAKPSSDGSLFLDAGPEYTARRPVRLPGLTLRPRSGPGSAVGDMPFMNDLHFSSRGRAMLDNMRPSRKTGGSVARTLSRAEIEDELTRIIAIRGADAVNEIRDQASGLADQLGAAAEMEKLDDLIGAVLGSRDVPLKTDAARAHSEGAGFDPKRVELFEALQVELLREDLPKRSAQPGSSTPLSFFEAYFSNWIEGTEFSLEEAREIVFDQVIPAGRSEDAHDVLGTFELVNDPVRRRQLPDGPEGLIELLRSHHALMLERRPQANPGEFKTRANQAGGTIFVQPELVVGTLRAGFRFYEALPPGLSRAIFLMFLISEVHPFTDGNGRVGRVLMNAALSAVEEQRIVIPLPYRDDYLGGLRALSRNGAAGPLVRVLDHAQRYAAAIDWSDLDVARRALTETNAFVPPDVAEERGLRLQLPSDAGPR